MGYTFGKRSNDNLNTCHEDLQKIARVVISRTDVDFGISEGHRPKERQKKLFDEGKSKIDGITRLGKHNFKPSEAIDIYIYHPDLTTRRKLAYDKVSLAYVVGLFKSVAEELLEKGEITHNIRWGANWDGDGVIDLDQSFDDYPHIEIIKQ